MGTQVSRTRASADDHLLINQGVGGDAPEMPEELKRVLEQKMKALDALLAEKGKAKYKMELHFSKARSIMKTTVGLLCFFESGRKLHGGGDAKIYFCPGFRKNSFDRTWNRETEQWDEKWLDKPKGKGPCDAVIPDSSHGYEHLFCQKCQVLWLEPEVYGEVAFNLPMQKWAEVLTRYYVRLECNADVVLKYAPDDIRTKAQLEQMRQKGGEVLDKMRANRMRGTAIYPLKNIIKDTAGGADLARQFYKFLRA